MSTLRYVLGFDGGGTKTRCLVADETGRILGEGLAGPSNYQVIGLAATSANLQTAALAALQAAGLQLSAVAAACAGLAGVARPEDQSIIRPAFSWLAGAALDVVEDARVALVGALNGDPGAVVISGTGSIAQGMDATGRLIRVGGWGWILGDEGSGYDLGRRAVNAALAALDAAGPSTVLVERICQAWQLDRLDQVVGFIYKDLPAARVAVAGLVPLILQAAAAGDAVSLALLQEAGAALGDAAAVVLRRLALAADMPKLVAITGGVITGSQVVRSHMEARLHAQFPDAQVILPRRTPAEGAILMALRLVR